MQTTFNNISLLDNQINALHKIRNGTVLQGGVGTGKTYTSLFFYLNKYPHKPLYVITIAKKRNDGDWENEAESIGIHNITVDSWNNIDKYVHIRDAFFIFDEQKIGGYGKWANTFIKITRNNHWIALTATPGDTWSHYISIFIANNYFKHKTDFISQHVYMQRRPFPKILGYYNEERLKRIKNNIIVKMESSKTAVRNVIDVPVEHDKNLIKTIMFNRWDIFRDEPIENPARLMSVIRRAISIHENRIDAAKLIISIHDKIIVFYNSNYELDIIKNICIELDKPFYEYNGHKHDKIPKTDDWVYIVQYNASEGWNCISTDTILFYSLNYSYSIDEQCKGRIDRLNTPYSELYYYYLISDSKVDKSIIKSLHEKKIFSESEFLLDFMNKG